VRRSIAGAISSGLIDNAVVTDPKQTETTLRWKIPGFYSGSTEPLLLTVEVSRRTHLVHLGGGGGARAGFQLPYSDSRHEFPDTRRLQSVCTYRVQAHRGAQSFGSVTKSCWCGTVAQI
jgi:hypothetical protein